MVLMSFNSTALYAGLLKVKCDPGTKVDILIFTSTGSVIKDSATDKNNDGEIEFGIPVQNTVKEVKVIKISDGRLISYRIKINAGGTTLVSLEPFSVPGFEALNISDKILACIDIAAFLSQGNPFTLNQVFTITNGAAPQTTAIAFKDVSAYPDSTLIQLLDSAFISNLANYTGNAKVLEVDNFLLPANQIPTLSEWGLIIFGIILLAVGVIFIFRRKRLMNV
jgi:hypothetical protein